MTELLANWNYPSSIHAGAGRITELAGFCQQLGITTPLLVTDPGLSSSPMVDAAVNNCRDAGLSCGVFAGIQGNPTGENIEEGVTAYRDGRHDGVIAMGGGSALDAGKAVALMVGQRRPLWDFEDTGDNWTRVNAEGIAPVIAIPTTAGTGSEVGRASVITDSRQHVKKIIFHPGMLPAIVILDPELTIGLPRHLTAATGMDALSHNLEAFCCPSYHPIADGIAIEGIRLVREFLPVAVADGNDLEARTQMLVASTMGATAFQKGLGAMHALAHPLGAVYNAHHGLLNAILMPYVLQANREAIDDPILRLCRYLDIEQPGIDSFMRWILDLREQLGIPHNLAEIGIDADAADRIGRMATEDPSAGGNPIRFDARQYADLFRAAVAGQL